MCFSEGNTCFYGKCLYCKSKEDGVCAEGDLLEGAVVLMLPRRFKYAKHRHPWSRTYIDDKPARCSLFSLSPQPIDDLNFS